MQDFIAAGQFRGGQAALVDPQQVTRPGTLLLTGRSIRVGWTIIHPAAAVRQCLLNNHDVIAQHTASSGGSPSTPWMPLGCARAHSAASGAGAPFKILCSAGALNSRGAKLKSADDTIGEQDALINVFTLMTVLLLAGR